jgi:NAD(P)H dehydrogenase (quinone)
MMVLWGGRDGTFLADLGADTGGQLARRSGVTTVRCERPVPAYPSGVPFTFLRHGWYLENYTGQLATYVETGAVLGAAGDGRVSAANRADYAAAAATVLTGDGNHGVTYELGGDTAFTMAELAAEVTAQTGREVVYRDLPGDEYAAALARLGVPEPVAAI